VWWHSSQRSIAKYAYQLHSHTGNPLFKPSKFCEDRTGRIQILGWDALEHGESSVRTKKAFLSLSPNYPSVERPERKVIRESLTGRWDSELSSTHLTLWNQWELSRRNPLVLPADAFDDNCTEIRASEQCLYHKSFCVQLLYFSIDLEKIQIW